MSESVIDPKSTDQEARELIGRIIAAKKEIRECYARLRELGVLILAPEVASTIVQSKDQLIILPQ